MYLDVSDMYPKMYLGLVWDTCKIHAKYQDTCILLECNRAFKIHLRYIRIHEGYMYPSGYTQDTSRYIRIRILITTPPKLDNKPPRSPEPALSFFFFWNPASQDPDLSWIYGPAARDGRM